MARLIRSEVPGPRGSDRRRVAALGVCLLAAFADPSVAQTRVGDGSVPCGSPYVVESGDTLSRIAGRAYGDPSLYGYIADANRETLGGDPENIAVGMTVAVPCVDATGQVEAAAPATSMAGVVAAEGPLAPAELDVLFGPVALFPDDVLTPVLVAATFPLDVVKAARFVEGAQGMSDQERAGQAAGQPWDEAVRALAAGFPSLVTRMSDNVDWTEQAGEAVVAQTDAVLDAIQRLRSKAQENGYLVTNEAQTVEAVDDKIVIAPAEPNVVYVPTYDSAVVYAAPVAGPPVYEYGYDYGDDWVDWGDAVVAGGIVLGGAVLLDEIFDDDDWDGWDGDDIDWDRGDVTIDRGDVDIDVDRGDVSIGEGDRVRIGDSERTQIDRDGALGDRREEPLRAGAAAAGGASIATAASREAARQRIETRGKAGVQPASLAPSRQDALRSSQGGSRDLAADRATTRPAATTRPSAARSPQVSRPSASRPPVAKSPSRSTAFQKPSSGHRASAASKRGNSSQAKRSGGGRSSGKRR